MMGRIMGRIGQVSAVFFIGSTIEYVAAVVVCGCSAYWFVLVCIFLCGVICVICVISVISAISAIGAIVVRSFVLCWLCCWLLVDGRRCVVGCYQLVWVAGLCFIAGNT